MKHSVTTLNTKKLIAASLKKQVTNKPFSKVTVSEIIRDCGVNRKTFYYHFEDIHALLKWMLEQEAIEIVKQFNLVTEYEEAIYFAMDYIEENNDFLRNVYDSLGREELKRFFYLDFIDIMTSIVDKIEALEHIHVAPDFKQFVMVFYAEAIAGVLLNWIVSHEHLDREKTVSYISIIIRTSLPSALRLAASQQTKE